MDFVKVLSDARKPEWVKYPGTQFELKVKKLSTPEIDRCRRIAAKGSNTDLEKFIPAIYKRALFGIRGFTLETLEAEFGFHLDSLTKDDQTITRTDVINSEPIEPFWLNFIVGLAVNSSTFYFWMLDYTGQNFAAKEQVEEEEEKKTL